MCPRGDRGSVDRREEATAGAIEGEPSVLPGRALTQTRQPLYVAPDGAGVRLILFRQHVRLRGLLLRHIESLYGRVEHRVARGTEFLGHGPQEFGLIVRGVRVERRANVV